jgi:tetratricopeptide (TPR) repeat protein
MCHPPPHEDHFAYTKLCSYLDERGFSFQGNAYLKHSLELFERVRNKPANANDILSDIYYTLGAIANEINDASGCLQNNLVLLDMRTRSAEERGKPDVRLAAAHSQIGIAYMMGGKLALATEYFKQSVEIFKSLEDFQADMLGFPSANLGLAYWTQGQLDEAEEVFATALKEREEAFGRLDTMSYKYDAAAEFVGRNKTDIIQDRANTSRLWQREGQQSGSCQDKWRYGRIPATHEGNTFSTRSCLGTVRVHTWPISSQGCRPVPQDGRSLHDRREP